jgi:hypothetical protein
MEFIIREHIIPFTNINLALFILCYFKPYSNYINYINYINYDNLYSISYCWNHLIFFTFNGAYFMDNTSFKRMAIRKKLPMPIFHIGNMILHNLPFLYVNIYIPKNVTLYHSLLGCLTNLLWCYWATFGTFNIKYVYVYMKKQQQIKLYIINISSIFYVPLIYHINKTIRNNFIYV